MTRTVGRTWIRTNDRARPALYSEDMKSLKRGLGMHPTPASVLGSQEEIQDFEKSGAEPVSVRIEAVLALENCSAELCPKDQRSDRMAVHIHHWRWELGTAPVLNRVETLPHEHMPAAHVFCHLDPMAAICRLRTAHGFCQSDHMPVFGQYEILCFFHCYQTPALHRLATVRSPARTEALRHRIEFLLVLVRMKIVLVLDWAGSGQEILQKQCSCY